MFPLINGFGASSGSSKTAKSSSRSFSNSLMSKAGVNCKHSSDNLSTKEYEHNKGQM